MKTSEFLKKVKETISTPDKWIKGRLNNNFDGHCLLGAVLEAEVITHQEIFYNSREISILHKEVLKFLTKNHLVIGDPVYNLQTDAIGTIVNFNDMDTTTHADVMEVLDKAIAKAEKRRI